MGKRAQPFWRRKRLEELSRGEWESLCDGCAKCCLHKLEDIDSGAVYFTNVHCRLLDTQTCRCGDYANRAALVDDCVTLTPTELTEPYWLPVTCAYRLVAEGRDLPDWHPLVSGDPATVMRSGNSICGRTVCETETDDLEHHIVNWVR